MHTLTIDDKRRIRLPAGKPGDVLAYQENGDGSVTLTPVKADTKEPFPEGSLAYLCTPERDAEMAEIAKAFIIGVPKDHSEE